MTKLSAATDELPARIWQTLFDLAGVNTHDPLPTRHAQLLNKFLQVTVGFSTQTAPTLNNTLASLKQPADRQEQQLNDYCQVRSNCDAGVALTHSQMNDVIHKLFARRLDRTGLALPIASNPAVPQPRVNPPIAAPPLPLQKAPSKPARAFTLLIVVLAVILALFF